MEKFSAGLSPKNYLSPVSSLYNPRWLYFPLFCYLFLFASLIKTYTYIAEANTPKFLPRRTFILDAAMRHTFNYIAYPTSICIYCLFFNLRITQMVLDILSSSLNKTLIVIKLI